MQRVTPSDRDRAVRRLTTATGAITAGSIALTGAFMALAKHETDAKAALKARQKSAQLTAQQLALAAAQPVETGPTTTESPSVQVYTTTSSSSSSSSSSVPPATSKKKVTKKTVRRTVARATPTSTAPKTAPTTSTAPAKTTAAPVTPTRDTPTQDTPTQEPTTQAPTTQAPKTQDPPPPVTSSGS